VASEPRDVPTESQGWIAALYRWYAEVEAPGRSELFAQIAAAVAADAPTLDFLAAMPKPKWQPNLLIGAVRYLFGTPPDAAGFLELVRAHPDEIAAVMAVRRTQTNEPARCATLLPALARLRGPLALLEVGASAGLCLLPDRYAYAYGDYESRFADVFSGINARYDFSGGTIRPYAALNVSYDTRSGVPGASQIFNDDAAVISAGLRAPLGKNEYGYLFALGGYSIGLRGQPDYGDVRYGIAYSRDYGTLFTAKPHTQVNVSAAVYSRYQGNAISYLQGSHDARIAGALRGIAGLTLAADSHRLYYNNFAEGYAGLIVPVSDQINLRFVGVQGTYLPRGIDRPVPATYSGYRALLVFGAGVP